MKIQDIFKLNLKTRGGVKLFHRIMNRYGIPKEDNIKLKTNVEIASSGGGITYEYYKLNTSSSYIDYIMIPLNTISMFIRTYDKKEIIDGVYCKEVVANYTFINSMAGKSDIKLKILNIDYVWDISHQLEIKGKGLDICRQYFNIFAPTIIDELFIPISEDEYNKPID